MQAIGSLIELGIDFVPVPGVKPAFDILYFIWQNVEKASNNRDALRNLAVSAADILTAVNHVLEENNPNKHVKGMLRKLEIVLTDIRLFAAEHANMNLFKLLLKNVDVDGKIEFFQNRLQNLWVAFNIVALGSIGSEVHLIHQSQPAIQAAVPPKQEASPHPARPKVSPRPGIKKNVNKGEHVEATSPPPKRASPVQVPPKSATPIRQASNKVASKPGPSTTTQPRPEVKKSQHQNTQTPATPAVIGASSSTPYKIGIRKNAILLSSRYNMDEDMTHWGLLKTGTNITKKSNTFEVVQLSDSKRWKWTLAGRVISVSRHDPNHHKWRDSMDVVFLEGNAAGTWFSWIEGHASSPTTVKATQQPPESEVILRKKNSHSLIRKNNNTIEYKRPTNFWVAIVRGHSQSTQEHACQLTYISTTNNGRTPFSKVYRSGDTIVHERFVRADSWEPALSRRFRFETENHARAWYSAWKDCLNATPADDAPAQTELVTKYDCKLQSKNDSPMMSSEIWPDVDLRDWGTPKFQKPGSFVTTTFKWKYNQDNKITVDAIIGPRPDWFETLEIQFRGKQPALIWFAYLTGHDIGTNTSSATPRMENVTVTITRTCWMRKIGDSVETRSGTSDKWVAVFGRSYKGVQDHISHVSVMAIGSSVLPYMRTWITGDTIHLNRRRSAEESSGVSRGYQFDSEAEAQRWYDIWREKLKKSAA